MFFPLARSRFSETVFVRAADARKQKSSSEA